MNNDNIDQEDDWKILLTKKTNRLTKETIRWINIKKKS